jgi:hypothetical protein
MTKHKLIFKMSPLLTSSPSLSFILLYFVFLAFRPIYTISIRDCICNEDKCVQLLCSIFQWCIFFFYIIQHFYHYSKCMMLFLLNNCHNFILWESWKTSFSRTVNSTNVTIYDVQLNKLRQTSCVAYNDKLD